MTENLPTVGIKSDEKLITATEPKTVQKPETSTKYSCIALKQIIYAHSHSR